MSKATRESVSAEFSYVLNPGGSGQMITWLTPSMIDEIVRLRNEKVAENANCEAKVRAAVEAAIEEAAKIATHPTKQDTPEGKSWRLWVEGGGNEYVDASQEVKDYTFIERRIRALDASAIVARVMHKEEQ